MKKLLKLTIELPCEVINILKDKPECKSAFQLNKYLFFLASIYKGNSITQEVNSVNLYKVLQLSNGEGADIKDNLIKWNFITVAYKATFIKDKQGRIKAINATGYEVNWDYLFKEKTAYTMYSDKAKFLHNIAIFEFTDAIVTPATAKEIKTITEAKKRPYKKRINKPKQSPASNTPTPLAASIAPDVKEFDYEGNVIIIRNYKSIYYIRDIDTFLYYVSRHRGGINTYKEQDKTVTYYKSTVFGLDADTITATIN